MEGKDDTKKVKNKASTSSNLNEMDDEEKENKRIAAAKRKAARDAQSEEKKAEIKRKDAEYKRRKRQEEKDRREALLQAGVEGTPRLSRDATRKRAVREREPSPQREARLQDQAKRTANLKAKEEPAERRARLDADIERLTASFVRETSQQRRARLDANDERRKNETDDTGTRRRAQDALRHKQMRDKMRNEDSSDSEDDVDHIQPPRTLAALDIGPRCPCKRCTANIFGKDSFCCGNGTVFCPPDPRLPNGLDSMIYGDGPDAKLLKRKIVAHNVAFSMASTQRASIPAAPHGLPVPKVQGSIDAFPSALNPFGDSPAAFANIYAYDGQTAAEMRLKFGHDLNKEIIERIQKVMDKHNILGRQYKNMKDLMNDLNPNEEAKYIRLKIINAWQVDQEKLQAHKGVYQRVENEGSKDYICVFYKASVEQHDIELPGLIVYPYRSRKPMLPIPFWNPLVEPLCYALLRPYGELGFVPKRFPRKSEKNPYWRELYQWCKNHPDEAAKSELRLTVEEIQEKAGMLEDIPQEVPQGNIIKEGIVEMEYEQYQDLEDRANRQENADETENMDTVNEMEENVGVALEGEEEEGHRVAQLFEAEREFEEGQDVDEPDDADDEDLPKPRERQGESMEIGEDEVEIATENEIRDASGALARLLQEENLQNEAKSQADDSEESSGDEDDDFEGGKKRPQKRKFISHREYLVWQYQDRDHQENKFLNSGKLGQLFLIHSLTRILKGRFAKYREFNTEKIKTTKMKFLKAMERKAEKKGYKLGVATLMPRKVAGSPRWLQAKFENAVALANRLGKIDLFVTATCNTKWPEIQDNLKNDQTWADNPFLVNNVFNEKWKKLKDLILGKKNAVGRREEGIFGKTRWYSGSIEFQSRGPPHIHLVVSLKHHIKTVEQIEKVCQAHFPDATSDPILRELVEQFMIHSPCQNNPQAYCRAELKNKNAPKCKKNFPKEFCDTTKMGDRTYPELKRPDDGRTSSKNPDADCRYVVPYNGTLLSAWRGHINIEVVSTVRVVKYIFKYIFKGFDRVLVETITNSDHLDKASMTIDGHLIYPKGLKIPPGELERRRRDAIKLLNEKDVPLEDEQGNKALVYDELVLIQDMRVLTSCEAAWELAKYPRHVCSHFVMDEYVHEEDQEPLIYEPEDEQKVKEKIEKTGFPSKLKAWFALNVEDEDARQCTYQEIPYFYTFKNGKWVKKKKIIRNLIARIRSVPPRRREAFAIRLLCQSRRGITSFKDLRTVDGVTYTTYTEAAKALGIMNNQQEWNDCMREAASSVLPSQLRRLFMQILTNNVVLDPLSLYTDYKEYFFENKQSWTLEKKEAHALYHMQSYLAAHGKTLAEFNLPDIIEADLPSPDELMDDSGRRPFPVDQAFASKLREGLKGEQVEIFEEIFKTVNEGNRYNREPNDKNVFFLQGSGGTGKTVLMKALYYNLLAEGKRVACVAHTGIAASLLPKGTTAHRLFHIPLLQEDTMTCQVEAETADADYLKQFHCIIWDEATMTDNRIYSAVHRLMSRLQEVNREDSFGGTFFVLAGDWKQTLPIDPESRSVGVFKRTLLSWEKRQWIKFFRLTKNRRAAEDPVYAAYLEKIGMGWINIGRGLGRPEDELVELPKSCLVGTEGEVIQKVFGNEGTPAEKFDYFKDAAILAVDNKTTFDINNVALKQLLNTEEHRFLSVDTYDETTGLAALDPECYHQVTPSGMPPHELKLKEGAVVILLRNINVALGLTNGTRLIVTKIGKNILHLKHVHPRKSIPEEVILGKSLFASNRPNSRELSFTRKQFPLRLAFAITVNRAQGQTLNRAGLILRSPCFSHGQLYVALSRVRTPKNLFICNWSQTPTRTNNVVYPEVISVLQEVLSSTRGGRASISCPANDEEMDITYPTPTIQENDRLDMGSLDSLMERIEREETELHSDTEKHLEGQAREPMDMADMVEEWEAAELAQRLAELDEAQPMEVDECDIVEIQRPRPPDYVVEVPKKKFVAPQIPSRCARSGSLLLDNERFYCFANVVVQILYRLFKNEILEYDTNDDSRTGRVMKELRDIVLKKGHTKDLLRKAPGGSEHGTQTYFNERNIQHDAEEYLRYLLENELPSALDKSLEFTTISNDTCDKCKNVSDRGEVRTETLVETTEMLRDFNFYFKSCEEGTLKKNCEACGRRNVDHTTRTKVCIPESLRFMRVTISRLKDAEDPTSAIIREMEPPKDVEHAFQHTWKPLLMVGYKIFSGKIRHYTIYLKNEQGWLEISDSSERQLEGQPDMNQISMVIMEKMEKVGSPIKGFVQRLVPKIVGTAREKLFSNPPSPKPSAAFYVSSPSKQITKKEFKVFNGDMFSSELQADVIVNAANPSLAEGGGVCGVIFKKAGVDELGKECKKVARTLRGGVLSPGEAIVTSPCGLKSLKCIVHTAAPNMQIPGGLGYRRPDRTSEQNLRMCYINACIRAEENGGQRVVFPILGIGIYGYNQRQGIAVAIQSIFAYFEAYPQSGIQTVTFAIKDKNIYDKAKELMRAITKISFRPDEAGALRRKFEHDYDDRQRPQDVIIPNTPLSIASFISSMKGKK